MALTTTQVSELYVSIFNRASEGNGNAYWAALDLTAAQIANEMLATTDAATYFGTSLDTNQAFIEHVYLNTLNKTTATDAEGIAYWVGLLDSGTSRGDVVVGLVTAVADYSTSTDAATIVAYNQFVNRVAVSDYTAATMATAPTDYATSTSFSGSLTVTNDAATVTTAKASVDAIVASTQQAASIQLTAGTDSFVGTAGNDSWNAVAGTLTDADTILDSSSTDADVLFAEVTTNNIAARLQNIETINVNGKFVTAGLNLANVAGTTDLNVNTSILGGTATVTNASSLNALNLNAGANITTLSVSATASGTRDTVYVDAGSATNITVAGSDGADVFDITMGAGATATLNGGGSVDAYTVNVGATGTLTVALMT